MSALGRVHFQNPVLAVGDIDHGDPFVLAHEGVYYLYHSGVSGIPCYRSRDLVSWEYVGLVLTPGRHAPWAEVEFWAPEVVYSDGLFTMHVAATTRRSDGAPDDDRRRLGRAVSAAATGPFELAPAPLFDFWAIDGHVFRDDDGKRWLLYNVRDDRTRYHDGTIGCGNAIVRLDDGDRPDGVGSVAVAPTSRWEGNREGTWYWNEGGWVTKRGTTYVLMYSGGFYGDGTYAVGAATSGSPAGPWVKLPLNPIFVSGRVRGPGHNCVVTAADGATQVVVYHAYAPGRDGRRAVYLDRLRWIGTSPLIGQRDRVPSTPSEEPQSIPAAPVFHASVPQWVGEWWMQGSTASIGNLEFALGNNVSKVVAWCDGRQLVARVDGGAAMIAQPAPPEAVVAGTVVRAAVTSRWEETQEVHVLAAGTARAWPWGAPDVDVSFTIAGAVELRAGDLCERIASPPDVPVSVERRVHGHCDGIEMSGIGGGAVVRDVTITAVPGGAD